MADAVKPENTHTSTTLELCSVSSIEDELHALWRDVAKDHADAGHVVIRIRTLTLIAYGANAALAKRVRSAVPATFGTHPSRAVIIDASGADDQLSAWVSTVCQRPSNAGEQVCSEQITITVGEHMRRRLTGVVLPLVVSDLPLFVWWPGPWRAASTVRSQLFAQANRWIIDSSSFEQPISDLATINMLCEEQRNTAVSDLAWARLTLWRWMIAQVFDQITFHPLLDHMTDITLLDEAHDSCAILGLAWFASCLKWQVQRCTQADGALQLEFTAPQGHTVRAEIKQSAQAESGDMPSISISSSQLEHVRVTVEHSVPSNTLTISTYHGEDERVNVTELPASDDGTLLNEELNVHGHDRAYEAALQVIAQIAPLLEPTTA